MPTLKPSTSPQSQFVAFQHVPAYRADADTSVILTAFSEALSSLMSMSKEISSMDDEVVKGIYESYVHLRDIREKIRNEMDKADVMLDLVKERIA